MTAPIDPRAQAKADKAYRKATRPWYRKKRFWLLGGVALIVVISIASNGGSKAPSTAQPSNQAQATSSTPATPAAVADATDPSALADNGWTVDTFTIQGDGAGNFGADARIVNDTGADTQAAAFTMTVLDDSNNIVATLVGSASEVADGETATVQFASTDPFAEGAFLYDFQVDASY